MVVDAGKLSPEDVERLLPKALADSGEEDFAGYHLVPLSDNLVRIYWEVERTDVYRQDADPEHRFPACRMAARWFGNARQEEQEESDAS